MNGKDVIKKLEANGWHIVRIRGSHFLMAKDDKAVPVPVHGSKDLGKGLLGRIARETGVKL